MCLNIGVNILYSTTDIQLVLFSQCTVVAPLWSAKASTCLRIKLFFLTVLYMHIIYPSLESDAIVG